MPPTVMAPATGTLWHTCFCHSAPFHLQYEPAKVCKCGNPARPAQGLITPMPKGGKTSSLLSAPISPCFGTVHLFLPVSVNGGDHGQKPGLPWQRAWSWHSFRVWILRPRTVKSTSFCLSEVSLENDTTGYLGGLWSNGD